MHLSVLCLELSDCVYDCYTWEDLPIRLHIYSWIIVRVNPEPILGKLGTRWKCCLDVSLCSLIRLMSGWNISSLKASDECANTENTDQHLNSGPLLFRSRTPSIYSEEPKTRAFTYSHPVKCYVNYTLNLFFSFQIFLPCTEYTVNC